MNLLRGESLLLQLVRGYLTLHYPKVDGHNLIKHLPIVIALLVTPSLSHSADSDKGVEAFRAGDYSTALREFVPLAELGDVVAQANLGTMYAHGLGVSQSYEESYKWNRRAADQGIAYSQWAVGSMYNWGNGVKQDHQESVRWFRLAADQGYAAAQSMLFTGRELGQQLKATQEIRPPTHIHKNTPPTRTQETMPPTRRCA